MKYQTWFRLFVVLGLTLVGATWFIGLPTLAQTPVNNTFTYQGRLRLSAGDYLNDNCDFQFTLWDSGGTQVPGTGTLERNTVVVTDGYFSVDLDFGDVFNGDERTLQIAVRCPAGSGDYDTLNGRVKLYPSLYALGATNAAAARVPWSGVTGKPPGFADDVDDVVTYTNGFGLDLSPDNQFSVITGTFVNSDSLQRRVVGACSGEQTIQAINPDGSVRCAAARTDYAASDGVEEHVDPVTLHHVLEYDADVVQERVTFACGSQRAIRRINPNGSVYCEVIPQGDITAVYAGDGLTGGGESGVVTVTVEAGGITPSKLITSSVTKQKIVDGAVNRDKIADDAVTSFTLADGGLLFEDINQNECTDNKIMAYSTATGSWECTTDSVNFLQPGDGIAVTQVAGDQVISARVTDGVKLDSDDGQKIAVDYPGTGADTAAYSDHHHDEVYPCLSDFDPSCTDSPGGDVSGNYQLGFSVDKIAGTPIVGPFADGRILLYDGTDWALSNPTPTNLGLEVKIAQNDITDNGSASCPTGYQVVGGGCDCTNGSGSHGVEDAYPTGTGFFCDCNSSDSGFQAYALCIKLDYSP
jgi:hypothetical protein